MLQNYKHFHFGSFPDETNNLIFFKSPKTCFGETFYLLGGVFPNIRTLPKNQPLFLLSPYGPLTSDKKYVKQLTSGFREKDATDKQTN